MNSSARLESGLRSKSSKIMSIQSKIFKKLACDGTIFGTFFQLFSRFLSMFFEVLLISQA